MFSVSYEKVKQFHPDVNKAGDSDAMIRQIIQAYEVPALLNLLLTTNIDLGKRNSVS